MFVDTVKIEDAKSCARSVLSRTLALALITGIDQALQEGHELTQLQQIDIATMHIMAYHDGMQMFNEALEGEAMVLQLKRES